MKPVLHRRLLAGTVAMALLCSGTAAVAGDYPFAYRAQDQRYRLVVAAPRADFVNAKVDGQEIVLRFSGPLTDFDTAAALRKSAGWIENVEAGYDTVVFRTAGPMQVDVARGATELVVTLTRLPPAPVAPPAVAGEVADRADLRVKLLEGQLTAREGRLEAAETKLENLREALPESAEVTATLAGIAERRGRWSHARDLYRTATLQAPDDEELPDALGRLVNQQRSLVRGDLELRKVQGGETTWITRLGAEQQLTDTLRLMLDVERNRARIGAGRRDETDRGGDDPGPPAPGGVRLADGTIGPFRGDARRGDLVLRFEPGDGNTWDAHLYAGAGTAGLGGSWRRQYEDFLLAARIEWQRPNWDYIEGVVANGTRDRVAIGLSELSLGFATARLEVGANRYGLSFDRDLARSATVSGELRRQLPWLGNGWSLAYAVDGEYRMQRRQRTVQRSEQVVRDVAIPSDDPDLPDRIVQVRETILVPDTYAPIPIVNREVHLLTLGWSGALFTPQRFDHALVLDAYAGVGADRFGRGGWLAGATVNWTEGSWRVQLRSGWVSKIGRNGDSAGTVGLQLVRFF